MIVPKQALTQALGKSGACQLFLANIEFEYVDLIVTGSRDSQRSLLRCHSTHLNRTTAQIWSVSQAASHLRNNFKPGLVIFGNVLLR